MRTATCASALHGSSQIIHSLFCNAPGQIPHRIIALGIDTVPTRNETAQARARIGIAPADRRKECVSCLYSRDALAHHDHRSRVPHPGQAVRTRNFDAG